MSQSLQSYVRVWWRTALLFVLLVVFVNTAISFLLSKFYPSHCVRTSGLHIQRENLDVLEDPRQLYLYVDTPLLPLAEKDVIVRSAYVVDSHPSASEHTKYKNFTVILLEVKRHLLDEHAFESCGVGRHTSTKFEVYTLTFLDCSGCSYLVLPCLFRWSPLMPKVVALREGGSHTHRLSSTAMMSL